LLYFVEASEERDGDEDDDCFLAVADFELFSIRFRLVSGGLPFKSRQVEQDILPRELIRIAKVVVHSSCPHCWSRGRRLPGRYSSQAQTDVASTGWSP
jgi:hypothetical protein